MSVFYKNLTLWCVLAVISFSTCNLDDVLSDDFNRVTNRWEYGAGNNYPGSFRNFHYEVELLSDGDTLSVSLSSPDTDVSLWVYSPLGELIRQSWGSRSQTIFLNNLNSGTYRVIAGTNVRGEAGDFTLEISNNATDPVEISWVTLETSAAWDTRGGGNNYPGSPRNHTYTVEVTENNSTLDILQTSDDADVSLWLYSPLGELIHQSWGSRSRFIVSGANAGLYTMIAGTNGRGVLDADYSLNVNGQIKDLLRIETQTETISGSIGSGAGNNDPASVSNDIYYFDVTENNSVVDIEMSSPDFDVSFWLYDPNGEYIAQQWGSRARYMVQETNVGTYTLICGTNRQGDSGEYELSVVGKFTNFRKE